MSTEQSVGVRIKAIDDYSQTFKQAERAGEEAMRRNAAFARQHAASEKQMRAMQDADIKKQIQARAMQYSAAQKQMAAVQAAERGGAGAGGEGIGAREAMGLLRGGMRGGIAAFAVHQLSTMTIKAAELVAQFRAGEISAHGMVDQIAKGIPIFSAAYNAVRAIDEAITGDQARDKKAADAINEAQRERVKIFSEIKSLVAETLQITERTAQIDRQHNVQMQAIRATTARSGLKGIALERAEAEDVHKQKIAAIQETVDAAIRAEKKAKADPAFLEKSWTDPGLRITALEKVAALEAETEATRKRAAEAYATEGERHHSVWLKNEEKFENQQAEARRAARTSQKSAEGEAAENSLRERGENYEADLAKLERNLNDRKSAIDRATKARGEAEPDPAVQRHVVAAGEAEKKLVEEDAARARLTLTKQRDADRAREAERYASEEKRRAADRAERLSLEQQIAAEERGLRGRADEDKLRRQGRAGQAEVAELRRKNEQQITIIREDAEARAKLDAGNADRIRELAGLKIAAMNQETELGVRAIKDRQAREQMALRLATGGVGGRLTGAQLIAQERNVPRGGGAEPWAERMGRERRPAGAGPEPRRPIDRAPRADPAIQQRNKTNDFLAQLVAVFKANPVIMSLLGPLAGNYGGAK